MTPYTTIYDRFLSKIEDTTLSQMDEADREEMLKGWLDTAMSMIELDRLKISADFSDRDDELMQFNETLSGAEIEGIALFMVVAWYESNVNSLEHTLLFMGSKDERWTSQRDHWKITRDMQDSYRKRARKYFRNHSSRKNAYIEEVQNEESIL